MENGTPTSLADHIEKKSGEEESVSDKGISNRKEGADDLIDGDLDDEDRDKNQDNEAENLKNGSVISKENQNEPENNIDNRNDIDGMFNGESAIDQEIRAGSGDNVANNFDTDAGGFGAEPESTFYSNTERGSGFSSEALDIRQDTNLTSSLQNGDRDSADQGDNTEGLEHFNSSENAKDRQNTPRPPLSGKSVNGSQEMQKEDNDEMKDDHNEETEYIEKGLQEEDTEKGNILPDIQNEEQAVEIPPERPVKSDKKNNMRNSSTFGKKPVEETRKSGALTGRGGKSGKRGRSINGRGGRQSSFKNKRENGSAMTRDQEVNESKYGVGGDQGLYPYKGKELSSAENGNLPPPPMSDDEINSSGSDAMEPPSSYRRHHVDISRYEESKLRDVSNEGNLRHNQLPAHIGDATPGAKGRRVLFFRNGDIHFKPRQVLINHKTYINLEKLLVDLSAMVETSTGVKHIFSWPEGREVKSITDFENGKYYVCSSTNKLQRVDYGNSKEGHWKGGKIDRRENFLFQHDGKVQSPLRRPRVLTIISNMYRDSREKLILNTNSQMNFEDILNDIVNMVNIPNPPVRALYTEKKPHLKVESYSQLIRDFADHDNFIACGEELLPLELSSKRSSFNPNGSVDGSKRGGRKNQRSDGSRVRGDHSVSPTRNSDVTTHNDKVNSRHQAKVRRRKTDSVRVDINGKTREFFPPTMLDEEDDGMKPDKKLRLDWVYGFRGRDVKQNLAVLPSSGELVYFVAAVVVVYDKKFATQKHYLGHSEEITCLTVHPNGRFVATGQTSGKTPDTGAHVRIWDGMSLSTYAVVGLGTFQRGIACVNFSEKESQLLGGTDATSGDLLMAIDDSDRHVMTVWEWQTEKLVARTTTTTDPVVSGCFYPFDETILVTFGKEHIHFWTMFWEKGKKIMRDKLSGNFEDAVPKFVTSLCFSPTGDAITGDSSGAILIWSRDHNSVFSINENLSVQTRKAHKKSVSALCMLGDGTLLSGGGNEVKAWDSINSYSLVKERVLPESAGHVRSIVPINMGGLDGSIYVATTRNKILEGSLQLKFKFLIQGHVEELWAVESHPLEQTFVSAGHDQTVVKWSAVSHAPVWKVNVDNPCTSISIDPKGRLIALGTTAGKVVILNSYNGIQLTTLFSGNAQINALSFSPDAKMLAVGTFDGTIQIYYMQDEGHNFFRSQTAALKHSNMFIMHMDWSIDSRLLQTVLGDYDIVYWDVTTMQKIKAARTVRDVKWATHNCPIDHSIIGPWQNLERGEVINVVSRSQYRDLMVVGDSKGKLKLYKWPCSLPKSGFRNTKVYSSNVTCATFTCDDNFVITSGGNDAALMQFSVLDPVNAR